MVNFWIDIYNYPQKQKTGELTPEFTDLFVDGKAAMTVESEALLDRLQKTKLDVGIVSFPVDPSLRDATYTLRPNVIFGVNSDSEHKEQAWNVIKFINSEEVAKIKSKSVNNLFTRVNYSKEKYGHSLKPFYSLNYDTRSYGSINVPLNFSRSFNAAVQEEISKIVKGNTSGDRAVKYLQEQAKLFIEQE